VTCCKILYSQGLDHLKRALVSSFLATSLWSHLWSTFSCWVKEIPKRGLKRISSSCSSRWGQEDRVWWKGYLCWPFCSWSFLWWLTLFSTWDCSNRCHGLQSRPSGLKMTTLKVWSWLEELLLSLALCSFAMVRDYSMKRKQRKIKMMNRSRLKLSLSLQLIKCILTNLWS